MTWEKILERLLAIQKARDLPANWVVESIERCGHPPRLIWRKISKALGYTQYWADNWKWLPGQETEEPDPTAIDWEKWPIPESPPERQTPKPVLRSSRP